MKAKLILKLYQYICEHNPELIVSSAKGFSLKDYLEEKVEGVEDLIEAGLNECLSEDDIQQVCLTAMTADMRPSVFIYLRNLIKEEFYGDFLMMKENGTLTQETIHILNFSIPLFEDFGFSEDNADDRIFRSTVITLIRDYLRTNT
jgi:hypothetical protein